MTYFLPPILTLVVCIGAFGMQFGMVSAGKWLAIIIAAEILAFFPLMGIPGMLAMHLASPWNYLLYGKGNVTANAGPELWGAAIGISLWVPIGAIPAEWLIRSYFPDLKGLQRWSLFALVIALWSSFAPLVFYFQDKGYAELVQSAKLKTEN